MSITSTEAYPLNSELENRFSYHAPKPGQPETYDSIRNSAKALAYFLSDVCPNSRELSTALTKLDEVVFFANAAIARNS
jgi:hypothetical protein